MSAQATLDFNEVQLSKIKDTKPSGNVEKSYSFDNINETPSKDSDLSVQEDNAGHVEVGGSDSGRGSPVEVRKEVENNDVCDDSSGHV